MIYAQKLSLLICLCKCSNKTATQQGSFKFGERIVWLFALQKTNYIELMQTQTQLTKWCLN